MTVAVEVCDGFKLAEVEDNKLTGYCILYYSVEYCYGLILLIVPVIFAILFPVVIRTYSAWQIMEWSRTLLPASPAYMYY